MTYKPAGWSDWTTNIHIVDGKSGAEKQVISYDKLIGDNEYYYWMPSQVVFR